MVRFAGQIYTNEPEKVIESMRAYDSGKFCSQEFGIEPGFVSFFVDVDESAIGFSGESAKVLKMLRGVLGSCASYTVSLGIDRSADQSGNPIPMPKVPTKGKLHSDLQEKIDAEKTSA